MSGLCMISQASKGPLQPKLHRSGPVCVERMQERGSGHTVCSAGRLKAGRVDRAAVATDDVVTAAARIVGVVNTKLGMVKDIEDIRVETKLTKLRELEVLDQTHIEIQSAGIVEEISTGIAESQTSWRHKLRRIALERAKALRIVCRLQQAAQYVGIRGCDAQSAGDTRIVRE